MDSVPARRPHCIGPPPRTRPRRPGRGARRPTRRHHRRCGGRGRTRDDRLRPGSADRGPGAGADRRHRGVSARGGRRSVHRRRPGPVQLRAPPAAHDRRSAGGNGDQRPAAVPVHGGSPHAGLAARRTQVRRRRCRAAGGVARGPWIDHHRRGDRCPAAPAPARSGGQARRFGRGEDGGGIGGNSSGNIFIAFSVANREALASPTVSAIQMLPNELIDPVFEATVRATEEAIINTMLAAETMTGADGYRVWAPPHDRLMEVLVRYWAVRADALRVECSVQRAACSG